METERRNRRLQWRRREGIGGYNGGEEGNDGDREKEREATMVIERLGRREGLQWRLRIWEGEGGYNGDIEVGKEKKATVEIERLGRRGRLQWR